MTKSRFTEEQVAFALQQAEGGTSIREVCRKMGVAEVRRPKQIEEENRKIKQLVADTLLDKSMLQDAIRKQT